MTDDDIILFLTALFSAAWIVMISAMLMIDRISRSAYAEIFRLYDQLVNDLAANAARRSPVTAGRSGRP